MSQDYSGQSSASVDDVKVSLQKFGWPDYFVFVLMLFGCSLIGVYFAFKMRRDAKTAKSNKDAEDNYLVGGRKMSIFPVSMSLIASYISGITLLGTPTEIYVYGTQYMYITGSMLVMGYVMSNVYLPVFHEMKLTSTYQYLQRRFDDRVRLFGSVLFTLGSVSWLPIVVYVPALAFNQATGINVHWITPIVCLVCIFYTCVGGLKAVVWTDVIQTFIMFGAMLLVIVKGTIDIGGVQTVWERASSSGRLEAPNFTFDLRERHTIYSLIIGAFPHWLKSNAVSQNMVQRYLSVPTLKDARRALWIFIAGTLCILCICSYSGLLIYATYHDCDPLTTKLAKAKDQLLPLLVMETLGNFPGLPGLFVAGVFSAALSSLSTGLNSLSAVVLEDFFKSFCRKPLTERQTAFIMRAVVVIFGAICVGLVFVVERLGSVLQLSISVGAVTNGPLLGIFTMAVIFPWVEARGALLGGSVGVAFMAWLCTSAQRAIAEGELYFEPKPMSTEGCSYNFFPLQSMSMLAERNVTESPVLLPPRNDSFQIHHISYLYYTLLGATIAIVVGLITSFILGANKPSEVDQTLLAPFVRRIIKWSNKRKSAEQRMEPVGQDTASNKNEIFLEEFSQKEVVAIKN